MSVVVVGLSQRTVPLELLERLAVPSSGLPKGLADLLGRDFVSEAVILSTCHRVEIYAVAERFHGAVQDVRNVLSEATFVPPEEFGDHLYTYYDEAAVAHLFNVAAGLESVVLGESQILGQVREAWERARTEGAAASGLSALFRHALEVGKRVRSETAIGQGITSLSQAAVAMAKASLGSLAGRQILVLGTGEIGQGMAAALAGIGTGGASRAGIGTGGTSRAGVGGGAGTADLVIANRTWDRSVELAERVGGRPLPLDQLSASLRTADVLLACTGSPSIIVDGADMAEAARHRDGKPLLVVDLGMPRNIDPSAEELPGVTLLDLVDLRAFVEARLDERRKEVARVRAIVGEEVERYVALAAAREAAPTVTALHRHADDVRAAEVERFRSRLAGLDPRQREAVEALTKGIVAKLLHEPTVRLKDAAGSARGERLAGTLRELFDL